jgi:ADP-ribose pyrophosphatase
MHMDEAKPWAEVDLDTLLDCEIFSVERSTAESPTQGTQHEFYRIRCSDWVQVVPVTAAGQIVMIRQYRHGSRKLTLEIPGGLIDPGETPAESAARECLEETGYRAGVLRPLGALNPNPALFPNRLHAFYAEGVERVADIQNSATEHTELVLVPSARLEELLTEGIIEHALVAGTLWRYLHERG